MQGKSSQKSPPGARGRRNPRLADEVLAALAARWRLRRAGPGRYRAICPAHGHTRSDQNLSVRVTRDGVVLATCHSHGCSYAGSVANLAKG